LIAWFAEFDGRTKPVAELASPELLAMTEPLQSFLSKCLNGLDGDIEVIFTWSSAGLLAFSIMGHQDDIKEAKVLIGGRAEFQPFHS
jgi:valyl-tRNA synthetase